MKRNQPKACGEAVLSLRSTQDQHGFLLAGDLFFCTNGKFQRRVVEGIHGEFRISDQDVNADDRTEERWLIENPTVLPVPGAKNSKQAKDNAQALQFSLTADEVDQLSQATMAWRG